MRIKRFRTAPRGYPIEETVREQNEWGVTTTKLELVEVSEATLDGALFAVPMDYRPALPLLGGGYDLTKPDTVVNRLQSYWEGLTAWTHHLFR